MTPRPGTRRYRRYTEWFWPVVVVMALTLVGVALAAYQPLSGGFDTAAGGPAMTAAPDPAVPADNPFFCPGHAPSPAPPAPRGEPSPP